MSKQTNEYAGVDLWIQQVVEAAAARGTDEDAVIIASPNKTRGLTLADCRHHLYLRQFPPQTAPPGQRMVPSSFIEEYIELVENSTMNSLLRFVRADVARQIIDGGVDPDQGGRGGD